MSPSQRPRPCEVAVSEERYAVAEPGTDGGDRVEICYQTFGDPADEAVLLVMGLGGPMTWWDEDFCRLLAGHGFFVVRYDNRDTGRSTKLGRHPAGARDVLRALSRRRGRAPYSLTRMGDDGLAVLDALGVRRAHVCGISMGGMIAQTLAVQRPERVRSLVSIMSTTGSRRVGWQDPALLPAFLARRGTGREDYLRTSTAFWAKIASPGYPQTPDRALGRAEVTFDRGFDRSGVLRQLLAILTQPDRTRDLASVGVPSAVIHGTSDRMVHVSGGRATARALPGCELVLLPGMGHEIPPPLFGPIVDVVRRTAGRAR